MPQKHDNSPYQFIQYTVDDGVATILLNRPEARNALSHAMRGEVLAALAAIKADRSVKAVVLAGAGKHFCAGGDITTMEPDQTAVGGLERMQKSHHAVSELIEFDLPIVAAVDGAAYGAGFGMALAADFVIATPRTRMCMAFVRIGLVPDFGVFFTLPRIVGLQRAKDLILSGREIGAVEAKEMGIVYEIVEPERALARAQQLAGSFRHASAAALSMSKQALNTSMHSDLQTMLMTEAFAQGIAMSSGEHKEAIQRFLDKAPLRFQWPAKA